MGIEGGFFWTKNQLAVLTTAQAIEMPRFTMVPQVWVFGYGGNGRLGLRSDLGSFIPINLSLELPELENVLFRSSKGLQDIFIFLNVFRFKNIPRDVNRFA